MSLDQSFTHIEHAAARLGVPASWLRQLVDAGKIPHLRAGRRLLVNLGHVEQALFERAKAARGEPASASAAGGQPP